MTRTPAAIAFAAAVLISCPRCGRAAVSRPRDPARGDAFAPRWVVCGACGFARDWAGGAVSLGAARDPHFGLPLWLATPCCGEVLWTYGEAHLEAIAAFVGARLRGRRRDTVTGWANRALESRLPRWMKLAHHRAEVLKGVERLRRRLVEAGVTAE
ncbi:MAG: hypothetical protein KIT16_10535 [Rhodospirillaceae bacterium]|nr:hypothetical protein [Rhodospirillaceae bacterium]